MGKSTKYSEEFKEKTVRAYQEGDLSAAELEKNLGVNKHTVCNWIRERNNSVYLIRTIPDDSLKTAISNL